jgi:hypothetical protein
VTNGANPQLLFGYVFKPIQGFKRLLVEIEYRTFADGYMQLIGKIIPESGYTVSVETEIDTPHGL